MSVLSAVVNATSTVVTAVTPAPAPTPSGFGAYTGDVNLITPGVVGFFAIFVIAVATVFLLLDMNRRVRRTKYRVEVRERIAEEQAEEQAQAGGPAQPL